MLLCAASLEEVSVSCRVHVTVCTVSKTACCSLAVVTFGALWTSTATCMRASLTCNVGPPAGAAAAVGKVSGADAVGEGLLLLSGCGVPAAGGTAGGMELVLGAAGAVAVGMGGGWGCGVGVGLGGDCGGAAWGAAGGL